MDEKRSFGIIIYTTQKFATLKTINEKLKQVNQTINNTK